MTLDELRLHLSGLDRRLLELIAERQRTGREIARVKRATGYPTRDYAREREVILAVRASAAELGVPADAAEEVMRVLIRSSLATQEQASVAAGGAGSGQSALVIGGAGQIGSWIAQFLGSQGFSIEIADPAGGAGALPDWRASSLQHDYIVVATPLGATDAILRELAQRRPAGVVFDVGSLKTPLRGGLEALRSAGVRVGSIHPMFGPNTELLSGRHVIFIDLAAGDALERTQALFAPTMAEQVVMSLDEHDRLIAYVLGLSHAVNIAFFTALARSGEAAPRLVQMSSTTFDAQFDIASAVAQESAELYFEIQRLNEYGAESLTALAQAVDSLRGAVQSGDAARFSELMHAGREYTQGRQGMRQRRA